MCGEHGCTGKCERKGEREGRGGELGEGRGGEGGTWHAES